MHRSSIMISEHSKQNTFEELRKLLYYILHNGMVIYRTSGSMDYSFTIIEELKIRKGTFLSERHQVMELLKEGAFGYVTKCFSIETCEMEAVKINMFPCLPLQQKDEVAILE